MMRKGDNEPGVTRRSFLETTAGALTMAAASFPVTQSSGRTLAQDGQGKKTQTVSRILSRYATGLRYEDLTPEVVRCGKHLLLDTIGVALGGYASEPSRITRSVVSELGGRPEATIIGIGEKTSASLAALSNGVMVRYLDFMDVYFNLDGPHPSENIPVALAAAERQHASGKEMLVGMFLGYEIQGRMADTWSTVKSGLNFVSMGGYVTPIVAGRILKLTEDQMVNAIGLAGCTSHTTNYLGDQVTMIKSLGYPFTGQRGIEAALMAQKGMTGPEDVVEVFMRLIKFTGDLTPLTKGGDKPRILGTAIKPYAAEYMSHSALEALYGILKERPLKAADIESIQLQTFNTAIGVLARDSAYRPQTKEAADHSLPYCLAVGLIEGDIGAEQFAHEQWKDPNVIDLMSRIKITEDPALSKLYPPARPADLEIRTRDGNAYRRRIDYPKGDPHNPMNDDEVKAKFRKLARPLMKENRVKAIIDCVDTIENVADTGQLMKLLAV